MCIKSMREPPCTLWYISYGRPIQKNERCFLTMLHAYGIYRNKAAMVLLPLILRDRVHMRGARLGSREHPNQERDGVFFRCPSLASSISPTKRRACENDPVERKIRTTTSQHLPQYLSSVHCHSITAVYACTYSSFVSRLHHTCQPPMAVSLDRCLQLDSLDFSLFPLISLFFCQNL